MKKKLNPWFWGFVVITLLLQVFKVTPVNNGYLITLFGHEPLSVAMKERSYKVWEVYKLTQDMLPFMLTTLLYYSQRLSSILLAAILCVKVYRLSIRDEQRIAAEKRRMKMVHSVTGEWIYEKDTPEEKKCDLDRAADVITVNGYAPKEISIEELTERIVFAAEDDFMTDEDNRLFSDNGMLNREVFAEWLSLQSVSDYDYKA